MSFQINNNNQAIELSDDMSFQINNNQAIELSEDELEVVAGGTHQDYCYHEPPKHCQPPKHYQPCKPYEHEKHGKC